MHAASIDASFINRRERKNERFNVDSVSLRNLGYAGTLRASLVDGFRGSFKGPNGGAPNAASWRSEIDHQALRSAMPWIRRTIRPHAHDFALREARRDPRMRGREWPRRTFETLKEGGPLALRTNAVWQLAPLTVEAREAFARCNSEFWSVRHAGAEHAFALVVRPDRYLHERGFRGDVLVSEVPERVFMSSYASTLVVARDLAFTCGGSTSVEGLAMLCHALDDTSPFAEPGLNFRRRPPPAPPPVDEEDIAALINLAP